jgi:hypothetical protein
MRISLRPLGSWLFPMLNDNAQCRLSQPLHEYLSNLKLNLIEGQSLWSTSKVLVNTMAHIKKTTQCIPYFTSGIETAVERKKSRNRNWYSWSLGAWMGGALISWRYSGYSYLILEVSIPSPLERYPNVQRGIEDSKNASRLPCQSQ